jgi:N-acetyltransferase
MWISPITLEDEAVALIPLSPDHDDNLVEAAKDGELWKLWYTMVPEPAGMKAEIARRLVLQDAGQMTPFSIFEKASNKVVGMTTFMNLDGANRRLEIGSTWNRVSVQRSGLNLRCKILLLEYAFEQLDCIAVEFRTHFFNRQSRTAIEGLGAKLDGILRNHMIMVDGTLRDTCVYSIIASEWPTVRNHLYHRLRK